MDIFASHKKYLNIFLYIIIVSVLIIGNVAIAGIIENVDGFVMYRLNNGEYAKDTWVWLDINNDSVKECYRFDEKGHIAKNYVGHDNRRTNEAGQLVENGFVMKKLVNGTALKGDGKPYVDADEEDSNIINRLSVNGIDDLPFGVEVDNDTILTKRLNNELQKIKNNIKEKPQIICTYFIQDLNKEGGKYVTVCKNIIKINEYNKTIILEGNIKIQFEDIIELN